MQFHRRSNAQGRSPVSVARHPFETHRCSARSPLRALVADDEPFAHAAIRILLKDHPDFEIAGTACNGIQAVEAIYRLKPDVLFLDVDMPELDGFEVLNRIVPTRMPAVILTTGNPRLAQKTFELKLVDYLVKPFTRARFQTALDRARKHFRHRKGALRDSVEP